MMFLKISQNSKENTCARVSFLMKFQALWPATLLKMKLWKTCFRVNCAKCFRVLRTPLLQNTFGQLLLILHTLRFSNSFYLDDVC